MNRRTDHTPWTKDLPTSTFVEVESGGKGTRHDLSDGPRGTLPGALLWVGRRR